MENREGTRMAMIKDDDAKDQKNNKEATVKKPVKCFKCEGNHNINQCPALKKNKESDKERAAAATF